MRRERTSHRQVAPDSAGTLRGLDDRRRYLMPTIKVYHHGMTAGVPPVNNSHDRAKRGVVKGWSASAARNNTRWLRSVNPECYEGSEEYGVAFTLTLRDCPDTAQDWHRIRTSLIKRLARDGMTKLHWVTEWQSRGVPHLHGVVFFPKGSANRIIEHWLDLTKSAYGSLRMAQHLVPVTELEGWFKYLSKHAARGASHYQRSAANIPAGWETTGRVWGHCGNWITTEPGQLSVSADFFWSMRRIFRSWRKADARSQVQKNFKNVVRGKKIPTSIWNSSIKRIASSRAMLKCNNPAKSSVRGISEWMPAKEAIKICEWLLGQGNEIYS